jgi:hypothetical protein
MVVTGTYNSYLNKILLSNTVNTVIGTVSFLLELGTGTYAKTNAAYT